MPLVLEIEYLMGVAFAARGPDSAEPDWPVQPDRVFSALTAAWAARGADPAGRAALEWLERQPPPRILASAATARAAATAWVPPNDRADQPGREAWRTRAARRFPAALPQDPVVRLVWDEADGAPAQALDALARDVGYLGHSASLTRCRFVEREPAEGDGGRPPRRIVYPGRLAELEAAFDAGRRPRPGDAYTASRPPAAERPNLFGRGWLTFEIVEGRLDLRAAPIACKALIHTVMSGYKRTVGPDAVPGWVSGHAPDRSPARDVHLAAVPLAFAGFPHADGALLGLALVPPQGVELQDDQGFRRALAAAAEIREEEGDAVLRLYGSEGSKRPWTLKLAWTLEPERRSLKPARYLRAATRFASVTPIVLDRHLKPGSYAAQEKEMVDQIKAACARVAGVEPARVAVGKHSAVEGAPSAYPSGRAPRWTGWRTPDSVRSRRLVHAVVEFARPLDGPLLVGAGRFCGLGLCLPLDGEEPAR